MRQMQGSYRIMPRLGDHLGTSTQCPSRLFAVSFLPYSTANLRRGIARTQSPTNKNDALELPTFGVIIGVNHSGVQCYSLTLGKPPSWSWLIPVPGKYALHGKVRGYRTTFQFCGHWWVQFRLATSISRRHLSWLWVSSEPSHPRRPGLCEFPPALRSGDTVTNDRIERCCYC